MLNAIIIAVVAVSAVWVYLDATKNKIGKIPDGKGMFNMSAGAWGVVTLLLWIIGLPAYLIKRGDLIEKAKENPIEVKGRGGKAAALSIIGGLWVLMSVGGVALSALPGCDSTETKSLVGQIINGLPLVKASGAQFVSVKNATEQGYNQEAEIRSCSGTLVTTAGEDNLQYSIKWQNKDKGEFYVEAQIQ
ncbi:MAG: hypothetical protein JMN29_05125 [gamma proteobacterium endosymbiont of Lamellibrachia anaximandri]|nr:hypothetical protein [gamma proteobacterium endosymbiont of Lamellibrachia anaximandri]